MNDKAFQKKLESLEALFSMGLETVAAMKKDKELSPFQGSAPRRGKVSEKTIQGILAKRQQTRLRKA